MSVLEVAELTAWYGRKQVVFDATLEVNAGEIVVLLGHNGAGKSTILRCVHGLMAPRTGTIDFDGVNAVGRSPRQLVRAGMAFMPSERFVYDDLTVDANLDVAELVSDKHDRSARRASALELFPILHERMGQQAGTLSGGQKRMLSMAMLLTTGPRLLLLDEPSLGLAPAVVEQMFDLLRQLCDERQLAVLLVEQNVGQALRIADRVTAIRSGRVFLTDTAESLRGRTEYWDLF